MEPFDNDELSDSELDRLLRQWTAPSPPAHLRTGLFPESSLPWWRRLWTFSVPLPVACGLAVILVLAAWFLTRSFAPEPPRVVEKIERVQVPVVQEHVVTKMVTKYVYRSVPAQPAAGGFNLGGLKPVAELRPRIIRSGDAKD